MAAPPALSALCQDSGAVEPCPLLRLRKIGRLVRLRAEDGRLALEFPHYSPTVQTPSPLPSVLAGLQEGGPLGFGHQLGEDHLFLYAGRMAAFEAIERLQKFDWKNPDCLINNSEF